MIDLEFIKDSEYSSTDFKILYELYLKNRYAKNYFLVELECDRKSYFYEIKIPNKYQKNYERFKYEFAPVLFQDVKKRHLYNKTSYVMDEIYIRQMSKLRMNFYFNSTSVNRPEDYFNQLSDEDNQRRLDEKVVIYELKETNEVVANCHKNISANFNTRRATINEVVSRENNKCPYH